MRGGPVLRPVVRGLVGVESLVGDLVVQVEPVAKGEQLRLGHLLYLVGGVAGFDLRTERPSLDGLGEDRRRGTGGLRRELVGGEELAVVVAATRKGLKLLVGEVFHELAQSGVGTEEVLTDIRARLDCILLELSVDCAVHPVEQDSVDVLREKVVPAAIPRSP